MQYYYLSKFLLDYFLIFTVYPIVYSFNMVKYDPFVLFGGNSFKAPFIAKETPYKYNIVEKIQN